MKVGAQVKWLIWRLPVDLPYSDSRANEKLTASKASQDAR